MITKKNLVKLPISIFPSWPLLRALTNTLSSSRTTSTSTSTTLTTSTNTTRTTTASKYFYHCNLTKRVNPRQTSAQVKHLLARLDTGDWMDQPGRRVPPISGQTTDPTRVDKWEAKAPDPAPRSARREADSRLSFFSTISTTCSSTAGLAHHGTAVLLASEL